MWKNIPGFDLHYFVSDNGQIKSVYNNKERILNIKGVDGRRYVNIVQDNGQRKLVLVSQLVALAFIPNPNGYKYVRRRINDYSNNSVDNLYWAPDLLGDFGEDFTQRVEDLKNLSREQFCAKYGVSKNRYYVQRRRVFTKDERLSCAKTDFRARSENIIADTKAGIPAKEICAKYGMTYSAYSHFKKRAIEKGLI